jgi:hypothetical protein
MATNLLCFSGVNRFGSWRLDRLDKPVRSMIPSTGTAAQAAIVDPDSSAAAVDRGRQDEGSCIGEGATARQSTMTT